MRRFGRLKRREERRDLAAEREREVKVNRL